MAICKAASLTEFGTEFRNLPGGAEENEETLPNNALPGLQSGLRII
jgi:hypothetical protein